MQSSNSSTCRTEPLVPLGFWFALLGIILIWLFTALVLLTLSSDKEHIERAALAGDAFGFINSLFSTLALMAAIAGIVIQGKEFRHQLEEMTKSAAELEKQTEIYREQLKEAKQQTEVLLGQRRDVEIHRAIESLPFFIARLEEHHDGAQLTIRNHDSAVFGFLAELNGWENAEDSCGTMLSTIMVTGEEVHQCFKRPASHEEARQLPRVELHIRYVISTGHLIREKLMIGYEIGPATSDRMDQIRYLITMHESMKAIISEPHPHFGQVSA